MRAIRGATGWNPGYALSAQMYDDRCRPRQDTFGFASIGILKNDNADLSLQEISSSWIAMTGRLGASRYKHWQRHFLSLRGLVAGFCSSKLNDDGLRVSQVNNTVLLFFSAQVIKDLLR